MAGVRDSMRELGKRQKAVEVEPAKPERIKYRRGDSLLASAARLDISDRKAMEYNQHKRQKWQSDAWEYVSEIGEISYVVDFMANLLAKVRLYPATRPEPNAAPIPVDDEDAKLTDTDKKIAIDTLARLRSSQGGQPAIQRAITYNWQVAGECYLHATEDDENGEDWNIRSVDELIVKNNQTLLTTAPGDKGRAITDAEIVIRLWVKNERYSSLAYSPMRPLLGVCESLQLLTREIRATAKSRASAGILLMPEELSFGSVDPSRDLSDGEATDDPFINDLIETLIAPIESEGSAASVAPMVIRGPADYLDKVRHITLDRQMDTALDSRIDQLIMRIARGLNAPVEVTTGLQETTFANAAQVKKSEWDAHGEPMMIMMCDALTVGYFRPALIEAGVDKAVADQLFIWGDPTEAIAAPDPADNAEQAFNDLVISEEARRRFQGFGEADAPSEEEILRRLITAMVGRSVVTDPRLLPEVLKLVGIATQGDMASLEQTAEDVATAPVTAAGTRRLRRMASSNRLGKRLSSIDRDLRTRLITASDAALKKALDKAGNRVISKAKRDKSASMASITASVLPRQIPGALGPSLVASLGLTDDELLSDAFEQFGGDFDRWVAAAQATALNQLKQFKPMSEQMELAITTKQNEDRALAWESLYASLMDLARTKLYEASTLTAAVNLLGEDDGAFEIPASLIRKAMAQAGGETGAWIDITGAVMTALNAAAGGVAVSEELFSAAEVEVEAYQWFHGGAAASFEPHEALDGMVFVSFDDEALVNGFSFPETDYLFPGDHNGCTCDAVPIMVPESEVQ